MLMQIQKPKKETELLLLCSQILCSELKLMIVEVAALHELLVSVSVRSLGINLGISLCVSVAQPRINLSLSP